MKAVVTARSLPRKITLTSAMLYKPDELLKHSGIAGGWVTVISIPAKAAEHLVHSDDDRAMTVISYGTPAAGPLTVCVILQVGDTQLRSIACGEEADIRDWLVWLDATRRAQWLIYCRDGGRGLWLSHEHDKNAPSSHDTAMVSLGPENPDRICDIEEVGRITVELGRPRSTLIGSLLPGLSVETLLVSAAGSLLQPKLLKGSRVQFIW